MDGEDTPAKEEQPDEDERSEEENGLELPVPPEPTELRRELHQDHRQEQNRERGANLAGRAVDDSYQVSQELATTATGEVSTYLWEHWTDDLAETDLGREQFDTLASLPQSDAVRWVEGDVSWKFLVETIQRNVERRDELLGSVTRE
jgi:hypothetical protein